MGNCECYNAIIFSYKHHDTVKERSDEMALLIKVDAENLICHHIIMDQTHLNADDRHGPYFHERAIRWCNQ